MDSQNITRESLYLR